MGKQINTLNKEDVINYYISTEKTQQEAAEYFGVSPASFARFLKANGLNKTKELKGKTASLRKTTHSIPSKEEVFSYYITLNHTKKESSKYFQVSETTFSRWLVEYEIVKGSDKRSELAKNSAAKKNEGTVEISIDECKEYYIAQNHTVEECAVQFGVTKGRMRSFLSENGIKKDGGQINKTIERVTAEKYGVAFYNSKTKETQAKKEDACLKKYGVKNPGLLEKTRAGNSKLFSKRPSFEELYNIYIEQNYSLEECAKYFGVASTGTVVKWCREYGVTKDDNLRVQNINKTCKEKYGVSYYTQSEKFKKQVQTTCLQKFGTLNPAQSNIYHYEVWNDPESFKQLLLSKEKKYTPYELKEYFNVHHSTILDRIHALQLEDLVDINSLRSHYENELLEIIKGMGITNIDCNNRSVLDGKEIDIYLPDYKFGIEFNGEYYHSDAISKYQDHGGRSTKHQEKSLLAESKGVFLFHIFEHEWSEDFINKNPGFANSKKAIINRINMLTVKNYMKIPARKCEIRVVSWKEKKEFLDQNHTQGNDVTSNICLGLFFEGEIVACMTFGKSKYSKYSYELSRFCTKIGCIVQGGASKMFKWFVENHMKDGDTVVSYNDITKTDGKIYPMLGFVNTSVNAPNYWWINLDTYDIRTRYQEQAAGEVKRMHDLGYNRVCDCGTKTWVYTKK